MTPPTLRAQAELTLAKVLDWYDTDNHPLSVNEGWKIIDEAFTTLATDVAQQQREAVTRELSNHLRATANRLRERRQLDDATHRRLIVMSDEWKHRTAPLVTEEPT